MAELTEKQKMIAGMLYRSDDPVLVTERKRAHELCRRFRCEPFEMNGEVTRALLALLGFAGEDIYIEPPFFCDYGYNLRIGNRSYMNAGGTILDCAPVTIGERTKIGPNVQLITAAHPLDPLERAGLSEFAHPITIGDDVWIGAGVIVRPGVTIANRSVIGAGSVVTRDIPEGVIAVGNPCRVLRRIEISNANLG